MLSHWNLIANAEATGQVYSVDHNDCILGALPFFHSFGYTYTLWFPLLHGFKAVFHANPLDAKVIGELAETHRPTLFLATPTFCLVYLRKCTREQFTSIRHLLVGAEKLRPSLAEAFEKKLGVTLLEGYGCTEMGPAVSVNLVGADPKASAYKAGSVGRPLPHVALKIVDPETFEPLAEGETGLLFVNGPSRMAGYLGDEERTAQAYVEGNFAPGESIDLVGFSMGGLVSRYYVQRLGGIKRVKRFITIASPHRGTWTAFLRGNPGSRQMRPGSLFLADLNSDVALLNHIRFTSIWTPLDLMILPAKSSVLTVGRSISMNVPAHQLMVSDERVLRLVFRALQEGDVERPAALSPFDRTQRRSRESRAFAHCTSSGSGTVAALVPHSANAARFALGRRQLDRIEDV